MAFARLTSAARASGLPAALTTSMTACCPDVTRAVKSAGNATNPSSSPLRTSA